MPLPKQETHDNSAGTADAAPAPVHRRVTIADLIAARAEFDLLFIDPRRQLAALREFYVDGPGTLDRCLRLHEVMAPASVIVVPARVRDLGVIATELMPRCGFSRIARVVPLEKCKNGGPRTHEGAGDRSARRRGAADARPRPRARRRRGRPEPDPDRPELIPWFTAQAARLCRDVRTWLDDANSK